MVRYCTNCKKSFDFTIKSIYDLDKLICPECGQKIDKNSRAPVESSDAVEEKIGMAFEKLFRFFYVFYLGCALVGIVAFFLHFSKLLFVATIVSLAVFAIQLMTGFLSFKWGLLFLPLGAAAGYFWPGGYEGACLGIMVVFAVRHLIRDVIFRLFGFLVRVGNS